MPYSIKSALFAIGLSALTVASLLATLSSSASACEKGNGKVCDTSGVPTPVLPVNQAPVVTTTTTPTKPNAPTTSNGNGTSTVLAPAASQNQQSANTYTNQGGNSTTSSNAQVIQFGGAGSTATSSVNGSSVNGTIGCSAPFTTVNVGVSASNANSNSDNPGFDNQSGSSNSASVFGSVSIPIGASARQDQCTQVINQQLATNAKLDQYNTLNECRKAFKFAREEGMVFNRNIAPGVICPDFQVVAAPPAPAVPVVQPPVEAPRTPEVPLPRAPRTPEVSLPSTRN